MPNKLLLDKSDPEIADALSDCKVGDTKTLEITCEVTRDDDQTFEADVTGVAYEPGNEPAESPEAEAEAQPVPGAKAAGAKSSMPMGY